MVGRFQLGALLLTVLAWAAAAVEATPDARRAEQLKVVVSVAPLKGLVAPLLPPGAVIDVLIPPGASEHGYEVPADKLTALAKADLVVTVGLGLEPQITRFLKDHPRTDREHLEFAAIVAAQIKQHEDEAAEHHHEGEEDHHGHAHPAGDPHLWLDPVLTRELVTPLAEAIKRARDNRKLSAPDNEYVESAAARLKKELGLLHAGYQRRLSSCPGKTFIAAHDAYGWLSRRYGLKCIALTGVAAGEPTTAAIDAAKKAIKEQGVKAVFFEPQLNPAAGKRLAQIAGVQLLILDPLGSGDYFAMMRANLDALVKGLGGPEEKPASGKPPSPMPPPDSTQPTKNDK